MRRRILLAIVAVTAVATVVLTVPLAVITARRENADAVLELERVAQRAAAGVSAGAGSEAIEIDLPEIEPNMRLGVYLPDGTLVAGSGPATADAVTERADRVVTDGVVGTDRVLANPVVIDKRLAAVIRVTEPISETSGRVRRDVLFLVVFDLLAVAIAAAVGWFVAARLARPVRAIRDDAVRLGDGDFSIEPHHSGVVELDETAEALASTAGRLGDMLARERAFSADASHELRTPLAALRLSLETELVDRRADPTEALEEALVQVDRLEVTVTTLLDVARDRPVHRAPLDPDEVVADLRSRWTGLFAAEGRSLRCVSDGPVSAHVSRAVLDQIIDILMSNSLDHGAGRVTVHFVGSDAIDGIDGDDVVVSVGDEGRLQRDPEELFTRRDPGASGHGVGLSLARSLAEAEGGRLVLASSSPTTFSLRLPGRAAATAPRRL